MCIFIAHCWDVEGEEDWRQVEQVVTLVKTLLLLSSASLEIHIVNNDHSFYTDIVTAVTSWEVSTTHKLRSISFLTGYVDICILYLHSFHSHSLVYPPGLESLYPMFRVCATARLFIDQVNIFKL